MSVPRTEFLSLIGTMLGIGIALSALMLTTTVRIETRLDSAIAAAAEDRRAFQASMDQHRRDMQRLGERQARLEGQREGATSQ
ncbi:MAG: hypothetical protein OXI64_05975 [Defluviicoccus sp.]|nr:hypothetical protein [Defluviicoccus sp.]